MTETTLIEPAHGLGLLRFGVILMLSGCASPFAVTIEVDAEAFVAFDGSVLVAITHGGGSLQARIKGSALPFYAQAFGPGEVFVARITEPQYDERVAPGELLSPEGQRTTRTRTPTRRPAARRQALSMLTARRQ